MNIGVELHLSTGVKEMKDSSFSEVVYPTVVSLSDAGCDNDLAKRIRQEPDRAVQAMRREFSGGHEAQPLVVQQPLILSGFTRTTFDLEALLQDWTEYYNERWGIKGFNPCLRQFQVPDGLAPDFSWGVVLPTKDVGITAQRVYNKLGEDFRMYKWFNESLEDVLDPEKEARPLGDQPQIILCRNLIEADHQHKNQSANKITEANINAMGLLERLLLEDFVVVFQKWAEHLDVVNVTLCAGSRDHHGSVPSVVWLPDDRGIYVGWCRPGDRHDGLRVREVVPLQLLQEAA
ncbi:MAG: hypothetical protein ABH833_03385 [Parcubacteria group bacterium]